VEQHWANFRARIVYKPIKVSAIQNAFVNYYIANYYVTNYYVTNYYVTNYYVTNYYKDILIHLLPITVGRRA